MSWDVSLTPYAINGRSTKDGLAVRLPMQLSRALNERGYTRVKVTVSDAGVLLQPYKEQNGRIPQGSTVALPAWD